MAVVDVGVIDTTGHVRAGLLARVAAALNIQVTRDLPQFWNVRATVRLIASGRRLPARMWPVFLVDSLPPGEAPGFHLMKDRRPFAKVVLARAQDRWTVAVSHEVIEMLVDPTGNRMYPSTSIELKGNKIVEGSGVCNYLVEACDPCEARSYSIHGIAVSDFVTPQFYAPAPAPAPATRYSFTGAVPAPRQVLRRGYLSWLNLESDRWHQCHYHKGAPRPNITNLPKVGGGSLREWADAAARRSRSKRKG